MVIKKPYKQVFTLNEQSRRLKKMKNYIVLLAILAMLVVSGCTGGNAPAGNYRTFIGGTQGVSAVFDVDAPPTEVNVGDPFFVMVVLENMGEHTVVSGDYSVELKGFSPDDFDTTALDLTAEPDEDLQANAMNPDTGEVLESYPVYVQIPESGDSLRYNGTLAGNTQFPFVADICYKYLTTAHARLCVKEDLTKTSDTNVCMISGPQAITSSGGPIQISDFKEFSGGPNAVRFTFKVIEASAGGSVSERDSGCDTSYQYEDRIYVSVDSGFANLRCTGFLDGTDTEGYVKLSGGSRQITCTQGIAEADQRDYVKIVTITAEYDYEQSVATQVLVKPLIQ